MARPWIIALLVAMVLLVAWLDWSTGRPEPADLYDIPILIAAGALDLTGALVAVAGCSTLYLLTLWYYHVPFSIVDVGQVLVFLVLGMAAAQLVMEYLRVDDLRKQLLQLNENLNQRVAEAVAAERKAQRMLHDSHLMQRIKAKDKFQPVILNTSYTSYQENFMTWAAEAYVVKSFRARDLKRAIRNVLANQQ